MIYILLEAACHLPAYNVVVLLDFGQSLLPQRVYTAPPVTPPEFPFSPCTPLGPGSPRLPGAPKKWYTHFMTNVVKIYPAGEEMQNESAFRIPPP